MNEVARVPSNEERIAVAMRRDIPDLRRYLPPGVSMARFEAVCVAAILQNPDVMRADRNSLWIACRQAASQGLMPDGRQGALVVRFDTRTGKSNVGFMPMVAGLIQLMKTRGGASSVTSAVVYEGERFHVRLGDEETIEHERDVTKVGGTAIAVYAIATMKDGTRQREVMAWTEVEKVRKAAAKGSAAWRDWPEEMARKSVIRRLAKSLPSLMEDDQTRSAIEAVDDDFPFAGGGVVDIDAKPQHDGDGVILDQPPEPADREPAPPVQPAEREPAREPPEPAERPPVGEPRPEAPPPPDEARPAPDSPWKIRSRDGGVTVFPTAVAWRDNWRFRLGSVRGSAQSLQARIDTLDAMTAANGGIFRDLGEDQPDAVQAVAAMIEGARADLVRQLREAPGATQPPAYRDAGTVEGTATDAG